MTVNDIIRESNTIKLSDFVCLTSIQTQEDIKKLTEQGYDVGYTQSEWEKEYSLPAGKIFYAKSMYSSVYYVDYNNTSYPLIFPLQIFGKQRLSPIPNETNEEFCESIRKRVVTFSNLHDSALATYFHNLGGYLAIDALQEYVRRNEPSAEMFNVFFSVYEVTDFGCGRFTNEEMKKVISGMDDTAKTKRSKILRKLPDEVTIYRGEAEASTPYTTSFSWTTNPRIAYFFACRYSNGFARVITGKVKKDDILYTPNRSNEKEVLVFPEKVYDISIEEQFSPQDVVPSITEEDLDLYYQWRNKVNALYCLPTSSEHDALHTIRVLLLAIFIVQEECIELDDDAMHQLLEAITYHDIGRKNDSEDPKHGEDSVKIYKLNHTDPTVEFLIQYHCINDKKALKILESNKTIENKENALTLYKIMKDADALDRVRFGLMDLDERYLRFNASKQLVLTAKVCLESITDGK